MAQLERRLRKVGIIPLYSFTERVSVEETLPDGSVKKSSVFKHAGWVDPADFSDQEMISLYYPN